MSPRNRRRSPNRRKGSQSSSPETPAPAEPEPQEESRPAAEPAAEPEAPESALPRSLQEHRRRTAKQQEEEPDTTSAAPDVSMEETAPPAEEESLSRPREFQFDDVGYSASDFAPPPRVHDSEPEPDTEPEARSRPSPRPANGGRPAESKLKALAHTRIPTPFKLLDVYMLRNFLTPLLICFCGFIAIWLIFDLNDNLPDFIEGRVPLPDVFAFYLTQLPQFAMEAIPFSLLLALLYCLSHMSKSNELVAMMTAGISIPRILVPVFIVGFLACLVSLGLSYKLAPWAAAERKARLDAINSGGETDQATLFGQLFRNRFDNRTWHVRRMTRDGSEMRDLQVIQQDPDGNLIYSLNIRSATYNPLTGVWDVYRGTLVFYDKEGTVRSWEYLRDTLVYGLSETPERIVSANMNPEWMSVPELRQYLEYNADFPERLLAPFRTYLAFRWAWPWASIVVVLIAAPLGMAFSRGGVLSNVATSIFIIAGIFVFREVFLVLGQGNHLNPWLAAWAPLVMFFLLGLYLLYLRSTNRQMPKLSM